jgi:Xaa-Pro aminopeptidase
MFQADFFIQNRAALRQAFPGTAPIILTANGLLQRNGDATFAFRQDSSFWYLTGIDEPDVVLVMDKDKEYLIVPIREGSRAAFDGSVDVKAMAIKSGVETVLDEKNGWKQLESRLRKVQHVATLSASKSYISSHGLYSNPARKRLVSRLKAANSSLELLDLRPHITLLRQIKQPAEIKAIKTAIGVTEKALMVVKRKLDKYKYEYEIDGDITSHFLKSKAVHAYQPIIAADKNACTLHYIDNKGPITASSLVLLDVGAEVENYAADITRSYALRPSKRQQQVAAAVLEVQEFAVSYLKPGVELRDYESKVEQFMGEKLRELGLIKTIEKDNVRHYYPHSTSHFLGLDVHDVGDYERPLEPGMVLTVEPGIYIPEEGIGIRIEDDVLITKSGLEILSKKLPRTL